MNAPIQFIDRYGGHLPSTLTICDECEGMGWSADFDAHPDGLIIQCPQCHGSKRCRWFTAFLRIPRWFWRGVRFFPHGMAFDIDAPYWTRVKITFWCAWGADIARLFR